MSKTLSEALNLQKDPRPPVQKAAADLSTKLDEVNSFVDSVYTWKFQKKFWGIILLIFIMIPIISIKW